MLPALTVYIDEAGDPGVREGVRYESTRHEWLCLSAVVTRTTREPHTIDWIKEMRSAANSRQSGALHYQKITLERRAPVCQVLGQKPVRVFCVASHKSNMRSHVNPILGKMAKGDHFYNWCIRLLLERVTDWSQRIQQRENGQLEPLRVIFAERGGHNYEKMFGYLDKLAWQIEHGGTKLPGMGLRPPLLDRQFWEVSRAEDIAGLQLADTAASAFYQAANTASPSWGLEPARALCPAVARSSGGSRANYGLTVWPLRHQSTVPPSSRPIFEFYGYKFD